VGKGTVVRALRLLVPDLVHSVSVTTRAPRPGEREGIAYWFVSDEEFDRLEREHAFLESAAMFGHRSGTLLEPIERAVVEGGDVVLEIDVQGAAQVRERVPGAVLIFLMPPSRDALRERLRARDTERGSDLEGRLAAADREIEAAVGFDHVVTNDQVDRAAAEVAAIIERSHPPGSSELGRP
jgi:guanylate kinase